MRPTHVLTFTAALSLAACAEPTLDDAAPAPLLPAAGSAVPGSYLVGLHPSAAHLVVEAELDRRDPRPPVATVADELAALPGVRVVDPLGHAVRAIAIEADADGLALVRADPRVAYVEEDALGTPAAVQTSAPWGLDRIDQRSRTLTGRYYYQNPSPAPHVYIIDSGVRTSHAQFAGRVGNGASFAAGAHPGTDCEGHGTHVAGIAAGATYGVAKNAIVHSVRLTDTSCASSAARAVSALNWVAANRLGFAVANMSWAFSPSPTIDAAANGLVGVGVPLVIAAGNDGLDACDYSPGRTPAVVTVGASTSADTRWNDAQYRASNTGPCLDLFAPGAGILSADKDTDTDTLTRSGTSMASPFVAGAIARYFADKPGYTPAQIACIAFGGAGCADANGAATVVDVAPGTGSPNKLLFIPGPAPRITSFTCPVYGDSGANQYVCTVSYSSEAPATIAWSGGGSASSIFRTCTTGSIVTVTVTVSNDFGADTRTASFACPVGPLP